MRAVLRGSDPERRYKISTAQGKKEANGSVINHTCSGEGVTVDDVATGSCRCTLSGGGVTADVVPIGSCRRTLSRGGLVADEVTIGSCRDGLTADVVMISSYRS
jgi:hypothetical protein